MDNDTQQPKQRYWSNGKPRIERPSCVKPRDKNGNVIKPGKSDTATPPTAPKAYKKRNTRDNIPVLPPPSGPKAKHRQYKSLEYEYKHKVIGAAHNLGKETRQKIMDNIGYACKFMQDKMHLNSIRSMGVHHIKAYAEYMKNEHISQKTKENLTPSVIYERIGDACDMWRKMNPTDKPIYPADIGVKKERAVVQNPVDFTKKEYANYAEDRQKVHSWIAEHYPWQKAPDKIGQAFGLREMERAGTRAHTITKENGKLMLDRGNGFKPVTPRQLTQIYGHASYGDYVKHVKEGEKSLIVEWPKDGLGRYVPIETKEQWEAIQEMRDACKAANTPSGRCIPWLDENGDRYSKESAVKAIDNAWQGAKNALGFTGKEYYGFTCNGDRHHYVQWCIIDQGMSKKETIIRVGHFSTDKLAFYVNLLLALAAR